MCGLGCQDVMQAGVSLWCAGWGVTMVCGLGVTMMCGLGRHYGVRTGASL